MKQPDTNFKVPVFKNDPEASRQLAAVLSKLSNLLRDLYDRSGTIKVVSSAPAATELDEHGDPSGEIRTDIVILDDATQSNRKLYYKFQGNLRLIDSA